MSNNSAPVSPSKKSINATRLSAMMNSLENLSNSNDVPVSPTKSILTDESVDRGDNVEPFDTPKGFLKSSDAFLQFSPAETRMSMYSSYSGVIQEGTGVSYVVKNNKDNVKSSSSSNSSETPKNSGLGVNLEEAADIDVDDGHKRAKSNIIIETIPNAKPVSRLNTLKPNLEYNATEAVTTKENTNNIESNGSIKLTIGNPNIVDKKLSIGSGNLASESGSSTYYSNHNPIEEELIKEHNNDTFNNSDMDDSPGTVEVASSSISSELPILDTYNNSTEKSLSPSRSEVNNYNPTVPLRNRNRPATRNFLDNELDKIEQELRQEMYVNNGSKAALSLRGDASYYSALSEEPSANSDKIYRKRKLPDQPMKSNEDNTRGTLPHVVNLPNSNEMDDDYEDVEDEHLLKQNKSRPSKEPSPRHRARNFKSMHSDTASSFDATTLTQLLMMTKGTLVGSEFSKLGMQLEEKKVLERLVDSLSRLTADMILDPDRYDEGLKRLNNAVKALDGF